MDSEPDAVSTSNSSSGSPPPSKSPATTFGEGGSAPPVSIVNIEQSYNDLEAWLAKLHQGTPLSESEVKRLCDLARETLLHESNVQPVSAPVTVCGDIHGKYIQYRCSSERLTV